MSKNLILIVLIALLSSCSGGKDFKIELSFQEDVQRMVIMSYADNQGSVKRQTVAIEDKKAILTGQSDTWTAAYLTWAGGEPIATCLVRNGDKVRISIGEGDNPEIKIKGSKASQRLADFNAANASAISTGNTDSLNLAVAEYIRAHTDDPVSTLLLVNYFDARGNEATADSLLTSIESDMKPASILRNYGLVNGGQLNDDAAERIYQFTVFTATDSFKVIRPGARRQTLVAVLSTATGPRAGQVRFMRDLSRRSDTLRMDILELSFAADSSEWRATIAGDSAKWLQAWAPANSAATQLRRLDIPREPFYILIDSTGKQIYRGGDPEAAVKTATENLKPQTGR